MLNDMKRNTKYRDAIFSAVENGHQRVLDIGTGTALLRQVIHWFQEIPGKNSPS